MRKEEQTGEEHKEEKIPEQSQDFIDRRSRLATVFRIGCLFTALLIIVLAYFFVINPSAGAGIIRGIINWYNTNIKCDYSPSDCVDGEYIYLLTEIDTYIRGGDGHPIRLFNCNQAKKPTWEELETFLWNDKTDEHTYIERGAGEGSFVCADYAEMLHNNAEMVGIKTAYVAVRFSTPPHHALNAFDTVDRGRVYIDCTGFNESVSYPCSVDKILTFKVGKEYIGEFIFSCFGYSSTEVNKGIVTDIFIHW